MKPIYECLACAAFGISVGLLIGSLVKLPDNFPALKRTVHDVQVTEALDIKESRLREEGLLKEVGLLEYQIDVVAKACVK